jgi:hypothetical protein
MANVLPEGYRKLIFGLVCLLGSLFFQYFSLSTPEMWKEAPGFVTPQTLFYAGILIGVGGNFADKLPIFKK